MAITKEEVAEAVRAWCQAWHTGDIETLLVMEAPSFGFGFRPFKPRDHAARGEGEHRQSLQQFFGQKEAYTLVLEDFETAVVGGEVGLAWGTFLETWQDKGQPQEQAQVRFSNVLTKGERGWQVVFYHRHIQPFAADGRYPKALTVVSPAA